MHPLSLGQSARAASRRAFPSTTRFSRGLYLLIWNSSHIFSRFFIQNRHVFSSKSPLESQLFERNSSPQQSTRLPSSHQRRRPPWLRSRKPTIAVRGRRSPDNTQRQRTELARYFAISSTANLLAALLSVIARRFTKPEPKPIPQSSTGQWYQYQLPTATAGRCGKQSRREDTATFWCDWRFVYCPPGGDYIARLTTA
jgi:hypothetical protein